MEEGKFETYVKKSRANLEMILFGKESMDKKIRNFFNLESKDSTGVVFETRICLRKSKIKITPLAIRFLYKISGHARYIFYHEFGENTYAIPLILSCDSIKDIRLSKLTASDVFGDLLASTFSPLTPEQQLKLFENKNIDDYDFIKKLKFKEYRFVNLQSHQIDRYKTKKEEGYVFGPELREFYKEVLKLQIGFDEAKRKEFQLKMYDTEQRQIKNRLKEYSEINKENLAKILFNAESLISELKSSPLF